MTASLLAYVTFSPLAIVAVHWIGCRLLPKRAAENGQGFLIALVILMNVPFGLGLSVLSRESALWVFALLIFNCVGYAYFHWFNLTETSRRGKILVTLQEKGELPHSNTYTSEQIRTRLERLVRLGQIRRDEDGRYRLRSRSLLAVGRGIEGIRTVLGFEEAPRS